MRRQPSRRREVDALVEGCVGVREPVGEGTAERALASADGAPPEDTSSLWGKEAVSDRPISLERPEAALHEEGRGSNSAGSGG